MQNKSFLKNIIGGIKNRNAKLLNNTYGALNINPIKLKILKHLAPGEIRKHEMLGGAVYFLNPQEFLHAIKELFILEIYKMNLGAKPTIIDCGANIGLSVIYLKTRFPDAIIEAYEPDNSNFELLKKNVERFDYNDIHVFKEAIWIENTQLNFASEGSMSSKIEDTPTSNANLVQAIRLKDKLNRKIDFLKIDIEGAEYVVLKDIQNELHHVENMFLEYHGSFQQNKELVEMLKIVSSSGFSFYIKEATDVYSHPFYDAKRKPSAIYDVQLNIFCFRN